MAKAVRETLRSFWHGSQLGAYQLICFRSFVDQGHRVELFTYDEEIQVPDWLTRRDAMQIWPCDRVLSYQTPLGRGSPALHANLLRYAILHQLGGWWVDADVVLSDLGLPNEEIFFAMENAPCYGNAVLKFPKGHPLLREAIDGCLSVREEEAIYGETGPILFSALIQKYNLDNLGRPSSTTFPVLGSEIMRFFDPAECDQMLREARGCHFVHLYNELWRRSGIPSYLAPPEGSFIDHLVTTYGHDPVFSDRMRLAEVRHWTFHLNLHNEFQAGLTAYRISYLAARARVEELERELLAIKRRRPFAGEP